MNPDPGFEHNAASGTPPEIIAPPAYVMVVEDDETVADVLRDVLVDEPLELEFATSGDEAVRRVSERCPDLILTDISLPGKTGLDVMRHARSVDPEVAVILMTFGITRLREMPVDVLPEFAPPFVEIQTEALGLSATEVEQLISLNLEELLSGTPWLQTIRSESVPGLSSLVLIFQPGTDILRARQLVQERLTLAHMLPNVSRPPVILQPLCCLPLRPQTA